MPTEIVAIEPFHGGSHKQLVDILQRIFRDHQKNTNQEINFQLYSTPAKKWHWRARTSALYFSQEIPRFQDSTIDVLFCSSVLNLTELLGLRSDLAKAKRTIVYFHENHLVYPVKSSKGERDFQYGYNQITTALAADIVVFNSLYNMNSFLDSIGAFLKLQPDYRPSTTKVRTEIEAKSKVLHFPLDFPTFSPQKTNIDDDSPLHIVWPHRWEHDKNPEDFFETLFKLKSDGLKFRVSILGEEFQTVPPIFDKAKTILADEILHYGRLDNRKEYEEVLATADVAVSTANHEFFGVAMMEATFFGCLPLVPNRLVYPELYPAEPCIYRTNQQLYKKLKSLCLKPNLIREQIWWTAKNSQEVSEKYSVKALASSYLNLFLDPPCNYVNKEN